MPSARLHAPPRFAEAGCEIDEGESACGRDRAELEKTVAPEMIAGKLVLIGTSAVGLNDIKTTPVSPAMPGVEIHAQVIESATCCMRCWRITRARC